MAELVTGNPAHGESRDRFPPEEGGRLHGRRLALRDGLVRRDGPAGRPADEDAVVSRFHGVHRVNLGDEAVLVHGDLEHACKRRAIRVGHERSAQNEQVRLDRTGHPAQDVEDLDAAHLPVALDLRGPVRVEADELDAPVQGLAVKGLQDASRCHDVAVQDDGLRTGHLVENPHGVLQGHRAAEGRAVGPLGAAGADALDEDGRPAGDLPRRELPLHLHLGDHVFRLPVAVESLGEQQARPRGEHDGPHAQARASFRSSEGDLEIAGVSLHRGNLRLPVKTDKRAVARHLDEGLEFFRSRQFRRVDPCHHVEEAAGGRPAVDEVHADSHAGQAAGGREARGPRADHQRLAPDADFDILRILRVLQEGKLHVQLVCRLARCAHGVFPVDPGAALPNVHQFKIGRM